MHAACILLVLKFIFRLGGVCQAVVMSVWEPAIQDNKGAYNADE